MPERSATGSAAGRKGGSDRPGGNTNTTTGGGAYINGSKKLGLKAANPKRNIENAREKAKSHAIQQYKHGSATAAGIERKEVRPASNTNATSSTVGPRPVKPDLTDQNYYVDGTFVTAAFEADVAVFKSDLAKWDREHNKVHNEKGEKEKMLEHDNNLKMIDLLTGMLDPDLLNAVEGDKRHAQIKKDGDAGKFIEHRELCADWVPVQVPRACGSAVISFRFCLRAIDCVRTMNSAG